MRFARILALGWAAACVCPAQNDLDGNKALFTLMAAMNAAGFDAGMDSPFNHPLRPAVREEIARRDPPSVAQLRELRAELRRMDPAQEYRLYVSYALQVDGAPSFHLPSDDFDLPPDIVPLRKWGAVLSKFYEEADVEQLWQASQPAFDQMIERYQPPVLAMVQRIGNYLRVPSGTGYLGKTFQILVDPLGPPNQIQFHTYFDSYYLVATASSEPQLEDVRSAYLHFLLDPVATASTEDLNRSAGLLRLVQRAPVLAAHYKEDYLLLATRSLIRAIEARMGSPSEADQTAAVQHAMEEGFILTAHFAEQLPAYEAQQQAMRLYFPQMAKTIDVGRERQRLASFEFTKERAVRLVQVEPAPPPELPPAERKLEEAENLYRNRQLEPARKAFLEAAGMTGEKPSQAKAYYGLARIAALNGDPELAEKLFSQTLELEPEPSEQAWSLVYLGRLADGFGEPDRAAQFYRSALGVDGISDAAKQAAEDGLRTKE